MERYAPMTPPSFPAAGRSGQAGPPVIRAVIRDDGSPGLVRFAAPVTSADSTPLKGESRISFPDPYSTPSGHPRRSATTARPTVSEAATSLNDDHVPLTWDHRRVASAVGDGGGRSRAVRATPFASRLIRDFATCPLGLYRRRGEVMAPAVQALQRPQRCGAHGVSHLGRDALLESCRPTAPQPPGVR